MSQDPNGQFPHDFSAGQNPLNEFHTSHENEQWEQFPMAVTMSTYAQQFATSGAWAPNASAAYQFDSIPGAMTTIAHAVPFSPGASPIANFGAPPQMGASSESGASQHSASSSAMASPHMNPQYQELHGLPNTMAGSIDSPFHTGFPDFVEPNQLSTRPAPMITFPYQESLQPPPPLFDYGATSPRSDSFGKARKSPRPPGFQLPPHPYNQGRRQSTSSRTSGSNPRSPSYDDPQRSPTSGQCPHPECGKNYKDLKAHLLTHQTERPEKCPVKHCEYHIKGFARKYDKNRHTLTHYKGTMVCAWCPGNGSSSEKTFNRADVFKRHLQTVHQVEQSAPNARRKSPSSRKAVATNVDAAASGVCSNCKVNFADIQDFYEHLDECVLIHVQKTNPAEALNEKHLSAFAEDPMVLDTLEKHNLTGDEVAPEDAESDDEEADSKPIKTKAESGGGSWKNGTRRTKKNSYGLTLSHGGVRLNGPAGSARKKRKSYPASWGCGAEKMKMKKRVMCVFDGNRRLCKDDLMLNSEFEVRVPIPSVDGTDDAWVTDLDITTLRRADAIFNTSDEERGPWHPDNIIPSGDPLTLDY